MIKVISRIFKSNALHLGKKQTMEEYKARSSTDKVERKWLLTLSINRKTREEVVKLSASMFKTNKYCLMLHSVALWNSLLQDAVDAKSSLGPKSRLMHG